MEFLYSKDTRKFKSVFSKYLKLEETKIWIKNDFYSVANYILSMTDYLIHKENFKRKLKVVPGDIVFANLQLAHKGEASFIQPVLVLSTHGRNRAFVVPAVMNSGYVKEAYHHMKKKKGNDRYYLFAKEESGGERDGVFILTNSQMISVSRITPENIRSSAFFYRNKKI